MKPSILIVEDDPFTASLLEFMFQRAQFNVTLLSDGQAASEHLEKNPAADIVLLDIMLPHVDGMRLLKQLRERADAPSTPVIMLSAKDQVADIQKAFACGADDYVVKPFDPDELLARAQRFLKKVR
jgi:DNA-binding response OmpR family regulator